MEVAWPLWTAKVLCVALLYTCPPPPQYICMNMRVVKTPGKKLYLLIHYLICF
jgi:hypothetical protein